MTTAIRRIIQSADESDCTDPNDYNCDGSVAYADADADGWAACEDVMTGTQRSILVPLRSATNSTTIVMT